MCKFYSSTECAGAHECLCMGWCRCVCGTCAFYGKISDDVHATWADVRYWLENRLVRFTHQRQLRKNHICDSQENNIKLTSLIRDDDTKQRRQKGDDVWIAFRRSRFDLHKRKVHLVPLLFDNVVIRCDEEYIAVRVPPPVNYLQRHAPAHLVNMIAPTADLLNFSSCEHSYEHKRLEAIMKLTYAQYVAQPQDAAGWHPGHYMSKTQYAYMITAQTEHI